MTDTLTPRQRQVLELAAEGLTQKEIAAELGISQQTVKNHFARLYEQYSANNVVHVLNVLGAIRLPWWNA